MKKIIGISLVMGLAGVVSAAISYTGTIDAAQDVGNVQFTQNATATIVAGGSITVTSSSTANMGIGSSGTGLLIIDGGALTLNGANNLLLGNGSTGNGTVDIRTGSFSSTPATGKTLWIGRDRSTGLLTIRGGAVSFGMKPTFDDKSGDGTIDFADKIGGGTSDGTLSIVGADLAYYQGLWASEDLKYQGANTAIFSEVFEFTDGALSVIPEPATLGMVAAAGAGLLFVRRLMM